MRDTLEAKVPYPALWWQSRKDVVVRRNPKEEWNKANDLANRNPMRGRLGRSSEQRITMPPTIKCRAVMLAGVGSVHISRSLHDMVVEYLSRR